MVEYFPSSIVVKHISTTDLGDDAPHVMSNTDLPFYSVDIQCQTKAVKLGVGGTMGFVLNPNETYWTYNANLRDFMIQNNTATEDGEVYIIATVPNKYVENALKGGFKRWG